MPVKISYVGLNGPKSPIYEFDREVGFVVGADDLGYVNVLPDHAWSAVEEFTAMAEEERQLILASVASAVEQAGQVGLDNLAEEARSNFCEDVGILFSECLRSLGVSPAGQDQLKPFTAVFMPGLPVAFDGEGKAAAQ